MNKNKTFSNNIAYLEMKDFDDEGLRIFKDKECVILIASENCPHCVNFAPIYQAVADKMNGNVDCDASQKCYFTVIACSGKDQDVNLTKFMISQPKFLKENRIKISGYPTVIKRKVDGKLTEFNESRNENNLIKWLNS